MSFWKDLCSPHHLLKDTTFFMQNFSLCGLESLPKHMPPFLILVTSYSTQGFGPFASSLVNHTPNHCNAAGCNTNTAVLLHKAGFELHTGAVTAFLYALMNTLGKQHYFQNELPEYPLRLFSWHKKKSCHLGNRGHLVEPLLWGLYCHFLCRNLKRDEFEGVEAVLTLLSDAKIFHLLPRANLQIKYLKKNSPFLCQLLRREK